MAESNPVAPGRRSSGLLRATTSPAFVSHPPCPPTLPGLSIEPIFGLEWLNFLFGTVSAK